MSSNGGSSSNGGNGRLGLTLDAIFGELLAAALSLAVVIIGGNFLKNKLDPLHEQKKALRKKRQELSQRLRKLNSKAYDLDDLTSLEAVVAQELVLPDQLDADFTAVGGLKEIKESLEETVLLPLLRPELFSSSFLLSPTKGVLLYGPPGTGKTLLVKALAKASRASFIPISPSTILSKWVGETNQLVHAIFSLAYKIQPCILFIDEIDSLFRERSAYDHEAYRDMKAEFMSLWDGLLSDPNAAVIVVGATNRPWDIDAAILRRMPRSFLVDYPTTSERKEILQVILSEIVLEQGFDFDRIAEETPGLTGSDLKEICRVAAYQPIREALQKEKKLLANGKKQQEQGISSFANLANEYSRTIRPLRTRDVLNAKETVVPTIWKSNSYREHCEKQYEASLARDNQDEIVSTFLNRLVSQMHILDSNNNNEAKVNKHNESSP
ncbi:ATPase family AAA domain-containing protein 1-A [Galdieria sulphuraria]|uniref:AAA-type ATPase n=1 Tax=Galdieria sulphuraria TaxID=130081 RepID=M2WU99_GALSU|nr:AAA-type ATPase [Galdieria sulphuraria]EME27490.1 AAA-type ATPase [Galdieria sulphuraria]GJD06456.1 ATPase family AAA domain-containing protein 1-A [Galdieria sulphuraria]|eukprot:XP_005704010.1 AAA-type ATPase [Galdieria sulphuraria]